MAPARLEVAQQGNELSVKTTRVVEYGDDQVTEEKLALDGTPTNSTFMNSPRVSTARLSPSGDQIVVDSVVTVAWVAPGAKFTSTDTWTLRDGGKTLSIQRHALSPRGEQNTAMVFTKL
jgi:hypothetical protein